MSYEEFCLWLRYRAKRGSLNTGRRVEEALARFQAFWVNCKTAQGSEKRHWQDFAPHADERVQSLEELTQQWEAPDGS